MPLYEHVFLARQDASTQQVEELTTQMTGIVEQAGGKVTKTENWGVRSLTYRMNKNRKAHFVLLEHRGAVFGDRRDRAPGAHQRRRHPLSQRPRRRA